MPPGLTDRPTEDSFVPMTARKAPFAAIPAAFLPTGFSGLGLLLRV